MPQHSAYHDAYIQLASTIDAGHTCVLDMDGTLLDLGFDDFLWNEALPAALAHRDGLTLDAACARVRAALDPVRGTLAWYSFEHWQAVFDLDIAALERRHRDRIRFLPGAREFLEHLGARGTRTLLATNAHPTSLALKRDVTDLARYFDALTSSHEFGHPKESPEFWTRFVDRHALDPGAAFLVDDNEAVLEAADAAGFAAVFSVARPVLGGPFRRASRFPALGCFSVLYGASRAPGSAGLDGE